MIQMRTLDPQSGGIIPKLHSIRKSLTSIFKLLTDVMSQKAQITGKGQMYEAYQQPIFCFLSEGFEHLRFP